MPHNSEFGNIINNKLEQHDWELPVDQLRDMESLLDKHYGRSNKKKFALWSICMVGILMAVGASIYIYQSQETPGSISNLLMSENHIQPGVQVKEKQKNKLNSTTISTSEMVQTSKFENENTLLNNQKNTAKNIVSNNVNYDSENASIDHNYASASGPISDVNINNKAKRISHERHTGNVIKNTTNLSESLSDDEDLGHLTAAGAEDCVPNQEANKKAALMPNNLVENTSILPTDLNTSQTKMSSDIAQCTYPTTTETMDYRGLLRRNTTIELLSREPVIADYHLEKNIRFKIYTGIGQYKIGSKTEAKLGFDGAATQADPIIPSVIHYGLEAGIMLKRLNFSLGLEQFKVRERMDTRIDIGQSIVSNEHWNYFEEQQVIGTVDTTYYEMDYVYLNGNWVYDTSTVINTTIPVYGMVLDSSLALTNDTVDHGEVTLQSSTSVSCISLPLLVGYSYNRGRWQLNVRAGAELTVLTRATYWHPEEMKGLVTKHSRLGFGFTIAPEIGYAINSRLSFSLSPRYKGGISSLSLPGNRTGVLKSLNIEAGLIFLLD